MASGARGIGLGLRQELAREMLERKPPEIDWVEVHPENFVERAGAYETMLADARAVWPVLPHGLSLSFGSLEPFEREWLRKLRGFLDSIDAPFYSDHLCFGVVDGAFLHDLLPLPFTRAAVELVRARVHEVEDAIGRPVAVENVSYYAHPGRPEMEEIDFLVEVLERTGCRLMLDVNNVHVNAKNHGWGARAYLDRVPMDRVVQIHVAGHLIRPGRPIIDTHGEPVVDEVFELLAHALGRIARPVPILLERDANYPPLDELLVELRRVRAIADHAWPGAR